MTMTEDEFGQILEAAMNDMEAKNRQLAEQFDIGLSQEWKANLEIPEIRFLNGGLVTATADVVVVGSLSHRNSWMWGWANQSLPDHVRAASEPMKAFGPETGLEFFTGPKWQADEEMAWWFCALACSRLQGDGAYRMPGKETDVFAVLKNVRRAGQ